MYQEIRRRKRMKLTPSQFAKQLPKWYEIYIRFNSDYFPLEKRLTQKANALGYLEMDDLVKITKVLGNPYNIAGKIQRENTNDEVKEKTREAIQHLNNPARALQDMMCIKKWGRTYASKTLRCVCPHRYAALDSKLIRGIDQSYLPSTNNEAKRYEEFLKFCQQIQQEVSEPGPPFRGGEWFLADIEIALFQFVWDENNKIAQTRTRNTE